MKQFETFLLQNETKMQEGFNAIVAAVTFDEKVTAAITLAAFVFVAALEFALCAGAKASLDRPLCPNCGKTMHSKGFAPRQMKTPFGEIHWEKRRYRCPDRCGAGG